MIKKGDILTFKNNLSYKGYSIARKNQKWIVIKNTDTYCQITSMDKSSTIGFSYDEYKEEFDRIVKNDWYIWDYIQETKSQRAKRIVTKFINKEKINDEFFVYVENVSYI